MLSIMLILTSYGVSVSQSPEAAPTAPQIPKAHPAQATINEAMRAFQLGDGNKSLGLFRELSEKHSDLPPGEILFARVAFAAGKAKAARASLELAATAHAEAPDVWNALGEIAFREGRVAEALLLFEKALGLIDRLENVPVRQEKQQIASHSGIASVAQQRKDWQAAEEHLRKWIGVDKYNPVPWQRLAAVFFATKRYEIAEQTLANLNSFDDSQPVPGVTMGIMYQRSGMLAEAEAAMRAALADHSEDFNTHFAVAKWALTAGNQELLDGCSRKAKKLGPDTLGVDALLGMSERFASRPEQAERIFARMLQEHPASFDATNGLALSLLEQQDAEKHQRALQHAKVLVKTNSDVRTERGRVAGATLAWALFHNGRIGESLEQIKAVITSGQVSPEVGYFASKILSQSDQTLELATELLSAALKSSVAFPERLDAEILMQELTAPSQSSKR